MLAKYATRCQICPDNIQPGQSITRLSDSADGGWVHTNCQPDPVSVEVAVAVAARRESTSYEPAVAADVVEVYTDGACRGNPGPGGWAWAVAPDRYACGPDPATTNQRMEIRAAFEAVRQISGQLVVVSDSTYVVNCFNNGWWKGWHKRGWTNTSKKPVANRDLWEPFVDLVAHRGDVRFRWVKGHSGDPMNDLVDQLAVAASHSQRSSAMSPPRTR